jgi:hypothetical protein
MASCRGDQVKLGKIYGWHVYVIQEIGHAEYCKIGSASRPEYRLSSLQGGNPRRLEIVESWHLDDRETARAVEASALSELKAIRIPKSEWIKCAPEMAIATIERIIFVSDRKLRDSLAPRWEHA